MRIYMRHTYPCHFCRYAQKASRHWPALCSRFTCSADGSRTCIDMVCSRQSAEVVILVVSTLIDPLVGCSNLLPRIQRLYWFPQVAMQQKISESLGDVVPYISLSSTNGGNDTTDNSQRRYFYGVYNGCRQLSHRTNSDAKNSVLVGSMIMKDLNPTLSEVYPIRFGHD